MQSCWRNRRSHEPEAILYELFKLDIGQGDVVRPRQSRVTYMLRDSIHLGDDLHHGIVDSLRHVAGVIAFLC